MARNREPNSKAIVTLAIGKSFRNRWDRVCRDNWQLYADRHDYDIICIDESLDKSERARSRSPAWQKCLILSQEFSKLYDRIVWVDSDVLLNPGAPDIAAGVPPDKVGAVDEYASPTAELYQQILRKLTRYWDAHGIPFVRNETAADYYRAYGFSSAFDQVVQTGVMALSPDHHRQILESVYYSYEETKTAEWNYEMRPVSYELLKEDCVHWIDPRFNAIWGNYKALQFPFLLNHPDHPRARECVEDAFRRVFFLHFAGSAQEMSSAAGILETQGRAIGPLGNRGQTTNARHKRWKLRTPVVLAIFNRPDTTTKVMEQIRKAKPSEFLIVADGPRPGIEGESEKCAAARAIATRVDWRCRVLTNFSDDNLGLRPRIQTGLDWVFEQVDEAIILEDDCLPHPTFFRFCDEMLERYRDDGSIMSISGSNFQSGTENPDASYYFSRYPHIWGWASWRRSWRLYDADLNAWPELRETPWLDALEDRNAARYWNYLFQKTYDGMNTWDYQLMFSAWQHECLSIAPSVNLVSNLGFRADATHSTNGIGSEYAEIPVEPMRFPLIHPDRVVRDKAADDFVEQTVFSGNLTRLLRGLHGRARGQR